MHSPLVSFSQVSLTYDGRRQAVDQISFEIAGSSIFALIGPNGAGKTSTMRMLATLAEPTSGSVMVDGLDVAHDQEGVRRRIGHLPDHFAMYDQMTPLEYLEFFARLHDVPFRQTKERIDQLLSEFDLDQKRSHQIRTLSRGMRQRLGIAKTLIHAPKLLILDEPASALDPGARARLKDALRRLRKRGLSILISSHILPDLADLADTVGIMESGKMVFTGPVESLEQSLQTSSAVYVIKLSGRVDQALRVFDDFGSRIGRVETCGAGRFDVEVTGGNETVSDLVEQLVLRGVRVSHVAARESTLEAIYRASAASAVA